MIQGSENFTGIALIDTDVYIPEGSGDEWYINQNQFYRQIRNFVFDLTLMNFTNYDNGQEYVPTGIHWQVSQATSLQNLYFNMPTSGTETTTAVGIFMENGSGGFLSDLVFYGGNIGFRAGSQQFTARNLHFTSCLTAIQIIWDWVSSSSIQSLELHTLHRLAVILSAAGKLKCRRALPGPTSSSTLAGLPLTARPSAASIRKEQDL